MRTESLKEDWVHNTENKDDVNSIWGACNHNLVTVDVDFDGKDEILSGPMAIDHDGSEMYAVKVYDNDGNAQKLAHGDAFDVAKQIPILTAIWRGLVTKHHSLWQISSITMQEQVKFNGVTAKIKIQAEVVRRI